jgi:prepilin-type N-terminal cleavage/methylation domain-containing protein
MPRIKQTKKNIESQSVIPARGGIHDSDFSDWIPPEFTLMDMGAGMTEDKEGIPGSVFRTRKTTTGFTLIEMMVSVALFAIVVMISMTAILSVVDSNKRAQAMKSVMNNLNFALETMTRSLKTGTGMTFSNCTGIGIVCKEITVDDQILGGNVTYSLGTGDDINRLMRTGAIGSGPITAPEVDIKNLMFIDGRGAGQPSAIIVIEGVVKLNERVSSDFHIQTTVTQRKPGI